MKLRRKQAGFSLIEMILVMGLSSLAFLGLIGYEVKKAEIAKAESGGQQFAEVGKALASYIAAESTNLAVVAPPGVTVDMPITVMMGTPSGPFNARQFLPSAWNLTNSFGTNYRIQIRNNGGRFEGLVSSTAPICEKGLSLTCPDPNNPIKYDWIGSAMKKMGANGAMTFNTNTTMTGLNGGWTLSSAQYTSINNPGQIGYRVSTTDPNAYDAIYLRLDGSSTMAGALQMGNNDITNARNIAANGNITATNITASNFVFANTVQAPTGNLTTINSTTINNAGNINNSGQVNTNTLLASNGITNNNGNITNAGAGNIINNNGLIRNNNGNVETLNGNVSAGGTGANGNVIANQYLKAQDMYFGNGGTPFSGAPSRTLSNVWLSDLLPNYVLRDVMRVNHGSVVTKPSCGTGTAKIVLTPQYFYMQGRVLGTLALQNTSGTSITLSQNQYSHAGYVAYATDLGGSWQAIMQASTYDGGTYSASFPMTGLAQVYCQYNLPTP